MQTEIQKDKDTNRQKDRETVAIKQTKKDVKLG